MTRAGARPWALEYVVIPLRQRQPKEDIAGAPDEDEESQLSLFGSVA